MNAEWTVDDRAGWDRRAAAAPWQQHWAYGEAVAALAGRVLRTVVRDGARVAAQAQFTARSLGPFAHGALAARGPVFVGQPDAAARAAALSAIRRSAPLRWPRLVLLAPNEAAEATALQAAGLRCVMTGGAAAMLDLRPDAAALRAAMDQKWRNRLVGAERGAALRVTLDDAPAPAALAALDAQDRDQQRARGYRALPGALAAAWGRFAGRRALLLAQARSEGRLVAAMLFVRHGTGALYHVGWQDEAGRAAGAHPLLLWRAMLALKAQGCATLDLGMLDTRRSPGLARFKLGAGARPAPLAGLWS